MRDYSEVNVELMVTNRPVSLIDEGIDVALRVRANIEDSSLVARPLADSQHTLYGAPSLVAERGEPKHPLDLIDFPHLSLHYTSGRYGYQLTADDGEQLTISTQPKLITDDMIVLREAAIQGQGLVSLPSYLCVDIVQRFVLDAVR